MLRGVSQGALELVAEIRAGRISAEQATAAALARAEEAQADLNAFITVPADAALRRARSLDALGRDGLAALPLAGLPVVVKDNICTAGIRTTAGSRLLDDFVPPYDATVVSRLEAAGAVVVAKANLDEFGMGSTNENSAYGPVLNPHDKARVAGGSSGGSAAAVAAAVAPVALGSDTGGSVRLPAAFCGVIGFKPTYGALSRYGLIAYASSLDQIGILATSVADVETVFEVLLGADPLDQTTFDLPMPDVDAGGAGRPGAAAADAESRGARQAAASLAGQRFGYVVDLAGAGISGGVQAGLRAASEQLRSLGAEVVPVSLPSVSYAVPAYYLIATAEASSNLARYDGMLYGGRVGADADGQAAVITRTRAALFGAEVKRRVLLGSFALSAGYVDAYYARALKVRSKLSAEIGAGLAGLDGLLAPTSPTTAYRLGEKVSDPVSMYLGDTATCIANLAGLPAISLPAGTDADGLPVGVQLMGAARDDRRLLAAAGALAASLR